MKIVLIVLAVLSMLLLLSTLICGLWIRAQGPAVDPSSLSFHLGIAVISILMTGLTLVLALVQALRATA